MKNSDKTEHGERDFLDIDCVANKIDEMLYQTLFKDLQKTALKLEQKKTKRRDRSPQVC